MKTSVHTARLGIALCFLPIFFLIEPALILQGRLHMTAIWVVLNILGVLLIAGASEGAAGRPSIVSGGAGAHDRPLAAVSDRHATPGAARVNAG